ncbi:hypothetical protein BVC80_1405g18 [Macleaya cordata]|uniref:Uncharacterized protein n=1 Tax=Macleaya cordata TaxID=56857 RepID=A0A200QEK7_MACCD|nr:hypothetical protein BVC80_1405g18 [Macleaya cordata]
MALVIGDGEGSSSFDDENVARSNQRTIMEIQYIRDTEANRRRDSLDRNREKGAQTLWED